MFFDKYKDNLTKSYDIDDTKSLDDDNEYSKKPLLDDCSEGKDCHNIEHNKNLDNILHDNLADDILTKSIKEFEDILPKSIYETKKSKSDLDEEYVEKELTEQEEQEIKDIADSGVQESFVNILKVITEILPIIIIIFAFNKILIPLVAPSEELNIEKLIVSQVKDDNIINKNKKYNFEELFYLAKDLAKSNVEEKRLALKNNALTKGEYIYIDIYNMLKYNTYEDMLEANKLVDDIAEIQSHTYQYYTRDKSTIIIFWEVN